MAVNTGTPRTVDVRGARRSASGRLKPARRTVAELAGVHKAYRRGSEAVVALAGADLTVAEGESVALVGRSGSGKSTLAHLAGGLDRPDSGSVHIDGADVASLSGSALAGLRRHKIGFVFQFFHLLPGLSVRENVALPLVLDRRRPDRAAVDGLLGAVGLSGRAEHLPSQLSGGEMQRVAIARALVADPILLVADEPTGNLDSTTAADILDLLLEKVAERSCALLFVTHDLEAAGRADRVVSLVDGRLQ